MKKKVLIIALLALLAVLPSFFIAPPLSPQEKIRAYYAEQFKQLDARLQVLQEDIVHGSHEAILQRDFIAARLEYKKLELFIEYYLELDAPLFNGLAIPFVEEEDPAEDHAPQGFQVIETFLYPHYRVDKRKDLLRYVSQLFATTRGLGHNATLFQPDAYLPDAAMDELYRVLALGITGFDSPLAINALPEAKASLQSTAFVISVWKEGNAGRAGLDTALQLLEQADDYIDRHNNFDRFNRMAFITRYLNPVCRLLGKAIAAAGQGDNPSKYALIRKTSYLFDAASLRADAYLEDDIATKARIALGKQLFYEPLLSASGRRSCAGCHQPAKAFTDGLPKAMQLDEHSTLPRNTPTLWNAGLQKNLFYDSRQRFLDNLILEVMGNEKEMNGSADKAAARINTIDHYRVLYRKAYPTGDTTMTAAAIANAIALYVRTLVSYNARFDQYMRGDTGKMTAQEVNGFNLFAGKAKCATCHYIPLFNGSKPPDYYYQESEVIGVPATSNLLHPVADKDPGRYAILPKPFLRHAFKTPTLRNVALTAPYMHNGVFKTLEAVMEFYNKGGGNGIGLHAPNQTLPDTPLRLSATEKKELIAFLKTLTDMRGD